jgi:ABC-2 type transport system ATP-binding protein
LNVLEIKNLSKNYAQHKALDNVSLTIPKGKIYGLLGPNGAGKTSLIRIITQIIGADEGGILFEGEKLSAKHVLKIGYLPEERGLYKKMKVGEQLLYLAQLKGLTKTEAKKRLKYWLDVFEMHDWWNKKIVDLSKGMQQKVQFIATVLHRPQLIILDEPFTGFDPINIDLIQKEIFKLRDSGASIIFSTHQMESVEVLCDYICLINKSKKILEGEKMKTKYQYQKNEYLFETQEKISGFVNKEHAQILEERQIEGQIYQSLVQLKEEYSSNALLLDVVQKTKIHSFKHKLPSINEIFIQMVKGG